MGDVLDGPGAITNEASSSFGKSRLRSHQMLRNNPARRSLSGAPLTCLFESKFQHLKALQKRQNETRGLNFLLGPSSQGTFYRSSLPVTPIGTPSFFQQQRGLRITEKSLNNRIKMRSEHQQQGDDRFHSIFDNQIDEVSESQFNLSSEKKIDDKDNKRLGGNTLDSDKPSDSSGSADKDLDSNSDIRYEKSSSTNKTQAKRATNSKSNKIDASTRRETSKKEEKIFQRRKKNTK